MQERWGKWAYTETLFGLVAWQWLVLLASPAVGFVVGAAALRVLAKLTKRTSSRWDDRLVERQRGPTRLIFATLFLRGAVQAIHPLTGAAEDTLGRILSALVVIGVAWAVERAIDVGATEAADRYEAATQDPAGSRSARTRILMLRRMANVLIAVAAAALVLTQFDLVRQVGVSILASAGIAGVVLGFAAQKSLGTIFAGLQISIAQPVRIGDAVVIEGEFGCIEEITLTFVVVRVWDNRRLVLPIAQLLEKPFQNWTRTSAELLGSVLLHVDYTAPIGALREEVRRACEDDPDWDGKVAGLVVVDALPTTVQLRALVSAKDAGKLWDLRCRVRERLVTVLQGMEGGRHLPRTRFEGGAPEKATRAALPFPEPTALDGARLPPPQVTTPRT